jgi:magnesium transporter
MIVDNAIYVDGRRAAEPESLRETYDASRGQRGIAWIGLYRPTPEKFESVAGEFELHPLAVEDATEAHQRPKLELRPHGLCSPQVGPLHRPDGDGRVQRDPRFRGGTSW